MTGNESRKRALIVLSAVFLTTGACRGGCRSPSAGQDTAPSALARFPAETRTVLSIDFRAIRDSPLWQELSRVVAQDPQDQKLIAEFTARTGLDPFKQVHGVMAAFPEEARQDGSFALHFHGEGFDQKRLLTYARDEARLRGRSIEQRLYKGQTLWTGPPPPGAPPGGQVSGFFLDDTRFVLAGGGWAEKMVDLQQGTGPGRSASAGGNAMLVELAERVGRGKAVWLAAIVPDGTRQRLRADARFGAQASVMRFGGSLDLAPGLDGQLQAELSNAEDARAMAQRFTSFLEAARRSPQALLLGAGPYLEGVTAEAKGPTLLVKIRLDEPRTKELATRLASLARLRR